MARPGVGGGFTTPPGWSWFCRVRGKTDRKNQNPNRAGGEPRPLRGTIPGIHGSVSGLDMNGLQASPQKIRPSRWFHLFALALIVVGALFTYRAFVAAVNAMQGGLTQAIFPGEATVSFAAPGNYDIYYEDHSEFNGRVFDTGSRVPGLTFRVTDTETGETLPLQRPGMSETYEMNGRTGRLVFQFHVAKPGSYKVTAQYDDEQQHGEAVFTVGNAQIGRFAMLLLAGILSIFCFGGGAVLVIVLIEVRRYSSKRKLQAAAAIPAAVAPPRPL